MMDSDAAAVLRNASRRQTEAVRRSLKLRQARKTKDFADGAGGTTSAWNTIYRFKDMRFFPCPGVVETLRRLNERDWRAKHG